MLIALFEWMLDQVVKHQWARNVKKATTFIDSPDKDWREPELLC
ncbi:hypothetical protein AK973_4268 [Pseudomonas brassicacearum]|jgi:hypothetical protein|nr:hypothetical protein AK973_4268 [Pseudomonas brassicacearum]